jgi:hypothetical protein
MTSILQLPLFPDDTITVVVPAPVAVEEPEKLQPIPVLPGQLSLFEDAAL